MNIIGSNFSLIIRLVFDTLIVWGCIYAVLRVVSNNARTIQLLKGILVVFLIKIVAEFFELTAVAYIIELFLNWGIVAILVIFQPEIRSILERMGNTSALMSSNLTLDERKEMIDEICKACEEMSKTKTGALITIEQSNNLMDYIQTGTKMDSKVSKELLGTIFQYGTPLHDGAVIIQGNRIACAAAYFTPTHRDDIPSKYGARHRAAIGVSEVTDSITIVVSEETGNISIALKGILKQYTEDELHRFLTDVFIKDKAETVIERSFTLQPAIEKMKNLTQNTKKSDNDPRVKPIKIIDQYPDRQGAM